MVIRKEDTASRGQDGNTKRKIKSYVRKNANFQTIIPRGLFEEIDSFLTEKCMTKVDFI